MRILIVDDDTALAEAVADEVQHLGHEARLADCVGAALEVMKDEAIDILLTDLRMAGRDGIELIKLVRQSSPQTRTILMSAFATALDYKAATKHGALDVLTKPFKPEDLLEALKRAEESAEGYRGNVRGFGLTDILQLLHLSRRSAVVRLDAGDDEIFLREGEIVHARSGALTGPAALDVLLARRSGQVKTVPLPEDAPTTIEGHFEHVLFEAMGRVRGDGEDVDEAVVDDLEIS